MNEENNEIPADVRAELLDEEMDRLERALEDAKRRKAALEAATEEGGEEALGGGE